MRTVLCYGDSNTWGCVPVAGDSPPARFPPDERWPGVLRRELGAEYSIVEAGLNGRTTVWEDGLAPYRNGRDLLLPTLYTAFPLDVVVVMLGTNDLKRRFGVSAAEIAEGAGALVDLIRASRCGPKLGPPDVLLVCPPPVGPLDDGDVEFAGAEAKSRELASSFAAVAEARSCAFLDAGLHVSSSEADGIHLDRGAHEALGKAIADAVRA